MANTVVNGGMEGTYDDESGGGGGTVNIAPAWSANGIRTDGSDTADKETTIVHSGSASQKIIMNQSNGGVQNDTNNFQTGVQYLVIVWLYATSGSVSIVDSNNNCINQTVTPPAAWTKYSWVITAGGVSRLRIRSSGGAATFWIDDVSVDEYYGGGAGARILNLMPMRRKRRTL